MFFISLARCFLIQLVGFLFFPFFLSAFSRCCLSQAKNAGPKPALGPLSVFRLFLMKGFWFLVARKLASQFSGPSWCAILAATCVLSAVPRLGLLQKRAPRFRKPPKARSEGSPSAPLAVGSSACWKPWLKVAVITCLPSKAHRVRLEGCRPAQPYVTLDSWSPGEVTTPSMGNNAEKDGLVLRLTARQSEPT